MSALLLASMRRRRLFGQHPLMRTAAFGIAYLVALALYPLDGGVAGYGASFVGAIALALATLAAIAFVPWDRMPRDLAVVPLLMFVASVALLREAHGGARSGYAPLVLLPVVWAAFFGRRRDAAAVLVAAVVAVGLPPLLLGAPEYPAGEVRRAFTLLLASGLSAVVIQALGHAAATAEEQLIRLRADEVHDDLVQAFAVAQLALATDQRGVALETIRRGLASAQRIASELSADASSAAPAPGTLRRERSSTLSQIGTGQ